MNRLRHSFKGYWRYMQMSQRTLFVFVESPKFDRYFYSKIVDPVCQREVITYEVVTAEELSEGDGGKQILLSFFAHLKSQSSLVDRFADKITLSAFFLDKDVDDYRRVKRRSAHMIYTKTYEIENYLFIYGDLCQSVGASTYLDVASVKTDICDYSEWRKQAASNWKDWVKLCLFSTTRNAASSCNYGRYESPINQGCYGALLINEYNRHLATVQSQSGMQIARFNRSFNRLSRHVDRLYDTDRYDNIFKGKWYIPFLLDNISSIAGSRRYNKTGLQERLLTCLLSSLNFSDDWADELRKPIQRIISLGKITNQ